MLTAKSTGCADILVEARARNQSLGLTGYLHLEDGSFYQWLEGPLVPLTKVSELIVSDPRHKDIEFLWEGIQADRHFVQWHMGFGTSNAGTLFNWVADQGVRVGDPSSFARGLLSFMQSELRHAS